MANNNRFSELAKLEWYRLALTNAKSEPKISEALNQIGVSADILGTGDNLFKIAENAYSAAKTAKKKLIERRKTFNIKTKALDEQFMIDRKKAKIAFLSDIFAKNELELKRSIPNNRLERIEMAKSFYNACSKNSELLETLSKLGISGDDIKSRLISLSEADKARADYVNEKGISQNATLIKSKAISELSKWMTQFFSISKNAFKEEPQLMESFDIVVKN